MQRGIGRLRAGGGGGNPAAAWAAAVTANGGTVSAGTLTAVTNFVASAKASGYWSKLNRINLFCGDQLAAALVPLKAGGGNATDTNVNFVGGDYTEATGLTGNGSTKYLRTGLIPSVSLALNDTHLAVYNRASGTAGVCVAVSNGASAFSVYGPAETLTSGFLDQYDTTNGRISSAALTTPYSFIVGTRTSPSAQALYRNATSVASSALTPGGSLPALEAYVLARNADGVATNFGSGSVAAYSIGAGLTAGDVTAYNTHMQAFQTALSRNV